MWFILINYLSYIRFKNYIMKIILVCYKDYEFIKKIIIIIRFVINGIYVVRVLYFFVKYVKIINREKYVYNCNIYYICILYLIIY